VFTGQAWAYVWVNGGEPWRGTGHIQIILDGAMGSVRDSYASAIRLLADPNRLDAQTCSKCNEVLTRTILCLQCSNVACQKEAEAHSKNTRHMFGEITNGEAGEGNDGWTKTNLWNVGIDSKTASMYCFMCQDFIYDPFIEKTRIAKQEELMEGNGGSNPHTTHGSAFKITQNIQSLEEGAPFSVTIPYSYSP